MHWMWHSIKTSVQKFRSFYWVFYLKSNNKHYLFTLLPLVNLTLHLPTLTVTCYHTACSLMITYIWLMPKTDDHGWGGPCKFSSISRTTNHLKDLHLSSFDITKTKAEGKIYQNSCTGNGHTKLTIDLSQTSWKSTMKQSFGQGWEVFAARMNSEHSFLCYSKLNCSLDVKIWRDHKKMTE